MIKVFLLDDHEVVRRGLRDLLEAEDGLEVLGGDQGRTSPPAGPIGPLGDQALVVSFCPPDEDVRPFRPGLCGSKVVMTTRGPWPKEKQ